MKHDQGSTERPTGRLASELVAANLRDAMAKRRLSGRALAEKLEWPVTTAARRFRGEQSLTVDEIHAISRSAEIPLAELMAGLDSLDQLSEPDRVSA